MATRLSVPLYSPERPALALANLVRGDPEGVVNSLIAPDKLTPKQHRDLVEQMFGPGESVGKSLARFFTNPLTIGAIALVVRYPAPTMKLLEPVVGMLKDFDRHTPAILSKLLGQMENFTGTGVDDAILWATRRNASQSYRYLKAHGDALNAFADAEGGRLPTLTQQLAMGYHADAQQPGFAKNTADAINAALEQLGVSGRIDPKKLMPQRALSAAEQAVIGRTRDGTLVPMQELYRDFEKAGILDAMQRDIGLQSIAAKSAVGSAKRAAAKRAVTGAAEQLDAAYFPHVMIRTPLEQQAAYNTIPGELAAAALSQRTKSQIAVDATAKLSSGHVIRRFWEVLPDPEQAAKLAKEGYLHADVADALKTIYARANELPIGSLPPRYDWRFTNAVSHYADSMIRAHTWRMPNLPESPYKAGFGEYMRARATELFNSPNYTHQRLGQMMADTTIPALLGRTNLAQYTRTLTSNGLKQWTAKMLERQGVRQVIGEGTAKRLEEILHYGIGTVTWHGAGGKLASWFYLSTLGFNPATAAQNLLQNFLTTGAMVKPEFLLKSLTDVTSKYPTLLKLQKAGLDEHEALLQTFPDFARQFIEVEPRHVDLIRGASRVGVPAVEAAASGASTAARSFADKALGMFSITERFNHLVAFYAGHGQAIAEGYTAREAGPMAAKLTKLAQMWSGPFSIPTGIQNWPGAARQFLTFPMKMAGIVGASAADAVGMGPGGVFNPGTLGRAVLGSMAAYEFGRGVLKTDLTNSLLFGATPGLRERGPFAPLPVVPPAFAVGGAVALDLAKGTTEETRKVLPLLVPGGVAASRALPLIGDKIAQGTGQAVGQTFGRPYADYTARDPSGRVAVYSADGNYVGHFSPVELFRRSMGLGGDVAADEASLVRYLSRQRDVIRDYRRRYITAVMEHDTDEAERINLSYQNDLGLGPIQVRKQDYKAFQLRQDLTRLQRVMKTIPKQSRDLYQNVVAATIGQSAPHLMGMDPQMFAAR